MFDWLNDRQGTVGVIGALSLTAVIGMGGMAVDLNRGYDQRMTNQRVADMAALAAALAYKANSATSVLNPTAVDVTRLNGLSNASVTAELVNDYPTSGSKAVKVTLSTQVPIAMAAAIGFSGTYTVRVTSYAALNSSLPTAPICILGLSTSGDAVSTSGGATIDAPECAVVGVGNVNNGGTRINARNIISGSGSITNNYGTLTTESLRYAGSFNNPAWNGNVPAADKRLQTATGIVDPLANNAALAAARSLLGSTTAPDALTNPVTPVGSNWTFSSSPDSTVAGFRQGNSAKYTVPAGTYTIGTLTVAGGIEVTFAPGSTITIAGGVNNGGNKLEFGNGDIRINGGLNVGSSGIKFGNGSLHVGSGPVTGGGTNVIGDGTVIFNTDLNVAGGASLAIGNGTHQFRSLAVGGGSWLRMGTGNVSVSNGITVGGNSTLAMGNGDYRFGSGSGDAINLSGSAVMIMGDGQFSANGNITTAGGSRIVFGRTTNHLINGNMTIAGSALFGTSRYTINGNFTNGTGGTTWPYTSPVTGQTYGNTLEGVSVTGFDMAGVNVTFVLNGTFNLAGGAKTKLMANPSSVSGGAIADVLIHSLTSSATNWAAGAQNVFVGAVHLPNSDVTMSGGTTTLSAGQCFMLIANRVTATGGAAAGSACAGVAYSANSGGTGTGSIGLVN
ncbi:hypothetical protein ACPVPU_11465 [Sphingomonas sp. CJ99]